MTMNKKLPIYKAEVDERDGTGIYAISFVEQPAVERNFVALARRAAREMKLQLNTHKQILSGVVLIPDQMIYRDPTSPTGECYISFSADDIEKIQAQMMRNGVALTRTTHQHEKPLRGNYLVECWTVADPKRDKAVALGLGELPKGTLCASYKVTDAKYWRDEVLTGNVKGFSLEGFFNFNQIAMNKSKATIGKGTKNSPIAAMFRSMAAFLDGDTEAQMDELDEEAAKDETGSLDPVLEGDLQDGGHVVIDETGYATVEGDPLPAGEHVLDDGNILVIDENSEMVLTTEESEEEGPEQAAAALRKANLSALLSKGKKVDPKAKERKANLSALLSKGKKTAAPQDAKDRKIARLEAKIAALGKQESTGKARQKVEAAANGPMKRFELAAQAIKSRQERSSGK